MFSWTRRFVDHPWTVVIVVTVFALFMGVVGSRIQRDNSLATIIPDDNPQIVYYDQEFKKYFDIRSRVVVGVFATDTLYNPETLAKVDRITKALEADTRLKDVVSLANVEEIALDGDSMVVRPMMETLPADAAGCAALRAKVNDDHFVRSLLVSDDEKATIVIAMPVFDAGETDLSIALYDDVNRLIGSEQGPETLVFAGFPPAIGLINKYMSTDIRTLLPIVVLVMVVVLYLSFQAWRGVWIPLTVVSFAALTTIGCMVLLGKKLSVIGTSIPIVLVSIGVADGIHVISEFYWQLRAGMTKKEAILLTMREMNAPVIMTSVTTFAGFLSLAVTDILPIRDYGLFVGLGVMAAMVFSLAFIPAMLMILPAPKPRRGGDVGRAKVMLLDRFSAALGRLCMKRPVTIAVLSAVMMVAGAVLSTHVVVSHDTMEEFRPDSDIRRSDELLNTHFGGTSTTSVVVDTGEPDGVKDPKVLAFIEGLQRDAETHRDVGNSESVADYVRRMHYAMNEHKPGEDRLPRETESVTDPNGVASTVPGRNLVGQYLLLYEMAEGRELARIVDQSYQRAHVAVNIRTFNSSRLEKIIGHIKEYIRANKPESVTVNFTGNGPIQLEIVKLLVLGQLRSLALSFILVYLMVVFLFRSARIGLLAMIPLAATVLFNFSLMVLSGITLNVGTALIASISIGTGVDYGIHFLHRFRLEQGRKESFEATIEHTMATSGRAILLNALAVGLGFGVLLFSRFMPLVYVGVLMPTMMLMSSLGAMLIVPTLLRLTIGRHSTAKGGAA